MSSDGTDTVIGKGDAAQGLVPRRRFPEFQDAGAWRTATLGELCSIRGGGTPDTSAMEFWDGDIPWITPAEMGKGLSPQIAKTRRTITQQALANSATSLLPANSIILSTRAPIGLLAINAVPMSFNQGCRGLAPKEHHSAYFLYITLSTQSAALNNLGAGSTFKELSGSALAKFAIPVPSKAEQQKIADCLSSLDDLIAAEGGRLAALRDHKKGLMQVLFPAQGQTIPRLRFPEFQDAVEWEEVTMQKALAAPATYGIVKAGDFQTTGIRMVRGGDIKGGVINTDLPLVSAEIHQEYRRTIIRTNDVLIALVGYPGEAAVVPEELAGSNVSRAVGLLRPTTTLNSYFLASYLNSHKGRREVLAPSAGSAQLVVNLGALNGLKLTLPKAEEQKRIADAFAAIDDCLRAQADRINTLKAHKSGLMHQLFPSPVEATA